MTLQGAEEILANILEQFKTNENGFGEPQAWLPCGDRGRNIEITHEKEGLGPEEEYYSLRLHCSEDEFHKEVFSVTNGIIETCCTSGLSGEQLVESFLELRRLSLIYTS